MNYKNQQRKKFKIKFQVLLKFDQILLDYYDGSDLKTCRLMRCLGLMLLLLLDPQGLTWWISFAPVFGLVNCWVLVFALSSFCVLICVF